MIKVKVQVIDESKGTILASNVKYLSDEKVDTSIIPKIDLIKDMIDLTAKEVKQVITL